MRRLRPGIAERLLKTEGNAPVSKVDAEDDRLDGVALLDDIACFLDSPGPRHLGNVDEPFDARLQFDKGAEVHDTRNRAADAVVDLVFFRGGIPGMRLQLLEAE